MFTRSIICSDSQPGDAFDLLCLQEDEYYFRDYSPCQLFDGSGAPPAAAALKLCSLSVYIVPDDSTQPIIRVPYASLFAIEESPSENDVEPGVSTPNILLNASRIVSIQQGGAVAPYSIKDGPCCIPLALHDATALSERIRVVADIAQAAVKGRKEEDAAAEHLQALISAHEAALTFTADGLLREGETVLLQLRGFRIQPLLLQAGWIVLTERHVYFQPYHRCPLVASGDRSTHRLRLATATTASRRKFRLKDVGLEVFFQDAPSLLVAFNSLEERNSFESRVQAQATQMAPPPALRQLTRAWVAGRLTNYEYLLALNEAAGRSFNDLTQYPVFPWVLQDYSSATLDLTDPATFRDLSRPVAALNGARVAHGREMYAALAAAGGTDPPWMFGSHYSNPGGVVFYLVRARPRLMLRLQNGRFDSADRQFRGIASAWDSVSRWNSDVKELVPEFYTPGSSAFLVNGSGADLGQRSDGSQVGDVELPPWAGSPEDFLRKMAQALEAPQVSARLHKWIDLVFGVKQRGQAAVAADNVFHFMTDDQTALRYLESEEDAGMRKAYEAQIREYGRNPTQLFRKKHPKKQRPSLVKRLLTGCVCATPTAGLALTPPREA